MLNLNKEVQRRIMERQLQVPGSYAGDIIIRTQERYEEILRGSDKALDGYFTAEERIVVEACIRWRAGMLGIPLRLEAVPKMVRELITWHSMSNTMLPNDPGARKLMRKLNRLTLAERAALVDRIERTGSIE